MAKCDPDALSDDQPLGHKSLIIIAGRPAVWYRTLILFNAAFVFDQGLLGRLFLLPTTNVVFLTAAVQINNDSARGFFIPSSKMFPRREGQQQKCNSGKRETFLFRNVISN